MWFYFNFLIKEDRSLMFDWRVRKINKLRDKLDKFDFDVGCTSRFGLRLVGGRRV